jgi:hypothetical protein
MQTYYASMHLATLVGMHTYSFVAVKSDFWISGSLNTKRPTSNGNWRWNEKIIL